MEINSKLKQEVSNDLTHIEEFRNYYTQRYAHIPLEECSQEIKQLVESIALLMARNRIAGEQTINSLYQRLFNQIYPYLASPLPALGLIKLSGYQAYEPTHINAGTTFIVSDNENNYALFRTQIDHVVHPVEIDNVTVKSEGLLRSRLEIDIKNMASVPLALEKLKIFINTGNEWSKNLKLQQVLAESQRDIYLELSNGKKYRCKMTLGRDDRPNINTIYEVRQYFQMPQQHSFMMLEFLQTPEEWTDGKLVILLETTWPNDVYLNSNLFQLNVVPIENIQYEDSETILMDGTKSQHRILPPNASEELELCHIEGVFKQNGSERIAIHPEFISEDSETYDLIINTKSNLHEIILRMPNAFDDPVQVVIEAKWHSPVFSRYLWKPLAVRFHDREVSGIKASLLSNIGRPVEPYQPGMYLSSEQNIAISALKNKAFLELKDLLLILDSIGSIWKGEYKQLRILLNSLQVYDQNSSDINGRVNQVIHYVLGFKAIEEELEPLIKDFLKHIELILHTWVISRPVIVSGDYHILGRHDLDRSKINITKTW
ncbi:type VI secretion system baseplate subunit TssF [Microbulbifer variabilis]|uniref:type VI secretion system baseplate subunit TssF n=1 Tax=Microbulbifer variabilis TaxID=266805 RepID=UPI001CFCD578|nr:type VI secretion system baseplate subunit TssF [Microbulbifer variabilis]